MAALHVSSSRAALAGLALVAACGGAATTADAPGGAAIDAPGAPGAIDAPAPVIDAAADAGPDAACVPAHRLFLNYGGGSYQPGNDDARTNRSSIVTGPVTAPAWAGPDPAALTACVRAALAPYDVEVVDVDPGAVPHDEVVFTSSATLVGLPDGVGSAASFACTPIPNAIGFVFFVDPDLARTCANALFVVGGAQGLEPVTTCDDYVSSCATPGTRYVDASMPCEAGAECRCGGATVNHAAQILAALGPHC